MIDPARAYTRLRGSPVFVVFLLVFVATWVTAHLLTGFDHAFGVLNLTLSTEASASVAFLQMITDRQAADATRQAAEMREVLDDMHVMTQHVIAIMESVRASGDRASSWVAGGLQPK